MGNPTTKLVTLVNGVIHAIRPVSTRFVNYVFSNLA